MSAYFPLSSAAILLGIGIGIILKMNHENPDITNILSFNPNNFFLIILPPIMFEAGFSMDKQGFFQNLGTILLFAIFGTLIVSLCFGGLIFLSGFIFTTYALNLYDSLLFGSLIAAVDPVATLAVFEALKVNQTLKVLVFGESTMNDAVSVALFYSFAATKKMDAVNMLTTFLYVFFGSILAGVLLGVLCALIFKHINLREHPIIEYGILLLLTYSAFPVCEANGLSGILGCMLTGLVIGHYTYQSLSITSKITATETYRMISFTAETFCFVYMGITLPLLKKKLIPEFIGVSFILLLITRAIHVFPLAWFINKFRKVKLTPKLQFIIWFCGLRGAISFSLALSFPSQENRNLIITTTIIICISTILLLGGGTFPLLKILGFEYEDVVIGRASEISYGTKSSTKKIKMRASLNKSPQLQKTNMKAGLLAIRAANWWMKIDAKYLSRWLIRENIKEESNPFQKISERNMQNIQIFKQNLENQDIQDRLQSWQQPVVEVTEDPVEMYSRSFIQNENLYESTSRDFTDLQLQNISNSQQELDEDQWSVQMEQSSRLYKESDIGQQELQQIYANEKITFQDQEYYTLPDDSQDNVVSNQNDSQEELSHGISQNQNIQISYQDQEKLFDDEQMNIEESKQSENNQRENQNDNNSQDNLENQQSSKLSQEAKVPSLQKDNQQEEQIMEMQQENLNKLEDQQQNVSQIGQSHQQIFELEKQENLSETSKEQNQSKEEIQEEEGQQELKEQLVAESKENK